MKLTFYSNFLNHHQLPFCMEMHRHLGDDFKFIATTQTPQERIELGYLDMNMNFPFVITTYGDSSNEAEAMELAQESDIIITGAAPEKYLIHRMKNEKITFRYSERIFKRGYRDVLSPSKLKYLLNTHTKYRNMNVFMLCASAYTSGDLSLLGAYKNKCYKWGYFPEVITYDIDQLMIKKNHSQIQILWCGRFLKWKHPETIILLALYLRSKKYNFHISVIGTGELEQMLHESILEEQLGNCISMLGAMPQREVRNHMERANIFLFTSDYNEGWGAVLNEAMNSGCAVVASHAIGSVPFLLKHNKNGLIYKNDKIQDFFGAVERLLLDKQLRNLLGKNAYDTLKKEWNAKVAVTNLLTLSYALLSGEEKIPFEGPCSKAQPVMQWNMYKKCTRKVVNI